MAFWYGQSLIRHGAYRAGRTRVPDERAFGLVTRSDWLLAPGAQTLLAALREAATAVYGTPADTV